MSPFFPRTTEMSLPICCCCGPRRWRHCLEHMLHHSDEWVEQVGKLSNSYSYRRFTEQLARARGTLPVPAEAIIEDRFAGNAEPHRVYELFFGDEAVEPWRVLFGYNIAASLPGDLRRGLLWARRHFLRAQDPREEDAGHAWAYRSSSSKRVSIRSNSELHDPKARSIPPQGSRSRSLPCHRLSRQRTPSPLD